MVKIPTQLAALSVIPIVLLFGYVTYRLRRKGKKHFRAGW